MTDQSDAAPAPRGTTRALGGMILRAGRGVRWYLTTLMGDHAYRTYADHHRAAHPGEPVMSEREFWRQRYADQDRNPGSRCC
ncbi:YbdD/YjiX family protein [Leucobacter weissii]|uniref:YbdD/YjiX family protein n=1 Tax=Leucobacter weissii TaxID=1983706 RepID=A0A939MKF1_9MICO|nr:YbdD/YjiX family protein [Leucobacter weissii]MBO1902393.1 YbdD/YjiX family protein [Leucobacter weissii]